MFSAVHTLIYSDDPEATRAFFRDVLQVPHIDTGGGWLIFKTGPSELGVHPTSGEGWSTTRHHEISLACEDIEATVATLTERGARVIRDVRDDGFGLTTEIEVPGADPVLIFQPAYPLPALMD
ncbi:MAG: VOC family protein [Actinomycetia bacterium]|nr:VOC family protein [Actinomycetes bacterium]